MTNMLDHVEDTVFAKNLRDGPTWVSAIITAQTGPVLLKVRLADTESGTIYL